MLGFSYVARVASVQRVVTCLLALPRRVLYSSYLYSASLFVFLFQQSRQNAPFRGLLDTLYHQRCTPSLPSDVNAHRQQQRSQRKKTRRVRPDQDRRQRQTTRHPCGKQIRHQRKAPRRSCPAISCLPNLRFLLDCVEINVAKQSHSGRLATSRVALLFPTSHSGSFWEVPFFFVWLPSRPSTALLLLAT